MILTICSFYYNKNLSLKAVILDTKIRLINLYRMNESWINVIGNWCLQLVIEKSNVICSCDRMMPSAIWEIFSQFLICCNLFHEPLGVI